VAQWFSNFHHHTKDSTTFLLKGDAHIRNFIVSNQVIYGVDFEEFKRGSPTIDITECCVSILLTTPEFTDEKFYWCKRLKKVYYNNVSWVLNEFKPIFHKILYITINRRANHDELYNKLILNKNKIKEIVLF
jgi:hypothetical protein